MIKKIASREADLVTIYTEMYSALTNVDRKGLEARQLARLKALNPPPIEPSEAAAVLKSILGSTSDDKLQLEDLSGVRLPDGRWLGGFVRDKLDEIGIGYHDFWPYLRVRGWLVNTSGPG